MKRILKTEAVNVPENLRELGYKEKAYVSVYQRQEGDYVLWPYIGIDIAMVKALEKDYPDMFMEPSIFSNKKVAIKIAKEMIKDVGSWKDKYGK